MSTPAPPPLVTYDGWKLACPGCPVVLLDIVEPEAVGAAGLRPGETVRVAGCTRAQTKVPHRYVFEAVDGHYSGVAVFDPGDYPVTSRNLECFEMLGEYKGTDLYAISVRYVDRRWEYEAGPRRGRADRDRAGMGASRRIDGVRRDGVDQHFRGRVRYCGEGPYKPRIR